MTTLIARTRRWLVFAATLFPIFGSPISAAADPAAVFAKKCTSCHTCGKGDRVGPDLKGVTTRRSRQWLLSWIRSSESMVRGGDPIAAALFEKYKHERMPDQNMSAEEIGSLIDYLAAGGPGSNDESRPRHAITATAEDVERGRELFTGSLRPRSGGAACASCHVVRDADTRPTGGTFGGDLTHVYSRFQDAALSTFLQRPCFPRVFEVEGAPPLTPDEAFAVKAYLRRADLGVTQAAHLKRSR